MTTRGYTYEEWCVLCCLCWGVVSGTSVELVSQLRVAVAEAQGQFGNWEEEDRPPLEAISRSLVKIMAENPGVYNSDL
jgi:hypothetical protein